MKHFILYLGTDEIYSRLPFDRLKSVVKCLAEELGEDVEDYTTLCIETGIATNCGKLNYSRAIPFDNISSLQNKLAAITGIFPTYTAKPFTS